MKKHLWMIAAALLAVPALAQAPKELKIYLNQHPYTGKAIWYKDEIYVPLADIVRNLGGSFAYNHTTGVVNVSIGVPLPPPNGVPVQSPTPH